MDREALVRLERTSDQSAIWQTTDNLSQTVFSNLTAGNYEVETSAVGYFRSQQSVSVMNSLAGSQLEILLQRDPSAVNLDVARSILSPKARKRAKNAVSSLKSGNLNAARKDLDDAYKTAPASAELNFLLGYLYFEEKDFAKAETYLETSSKLAPRDGQALTLLGRCRLERGEYSDARSILQQATVAEPDDWLPHNLLATAYLREKNYQGAHSESEVALAKAQKLHTQVLAPTLVLGESLIGLGRKEEGVQALQDFLKQMPHHPMAGEVRDLVARVQRSGTQAISDQSLGTESKTSLADPVAAIPAPTLATTIWRPPNTDDINPTLASGVSCPTTVVDEAGKRVEELVQDLTRFAAVEDLFHQMLDSNGIPNHSEVRKYDYVAQLSENAAGAISTHEYRSSRTTIGGDPDQIASAGFALLALVFHPQIRQDFDFDCAGLADWRGEPRWLVHFHQRADHPNRMHSYKIGDQLFRVDLKGVAWIAPDTFQIVRMEADMTKPLPDIQLLSEHSDVEYGPVPFPKKKTTLWLPKQAEIYFNFRKHNYYRRHSFDHYMLFSVDSEEKVKKPTVPDNKNPS